MTDVFIEENVTGRRRNRGHRGRDGVMQLQAGERQGWQPPPEPGEAREDLPRVSEEHGLGYTG